MYLFELGDHQREAEELYRVAGDVCGKNPEMSCRSLTAPQNLTFHHVGLEAHNFPQGMPNSSEVSHISLCRSDEHRGIICIVRCA